MGKPRKSQKFDDVVKRWVRKRRATAFPRWIANTYVPYLRWFKKTCRRLSLEDMRVQQQLVAPNNIRYWDGDDKTDETFVHITEQDKAIIEKKDDYWNSVPFLPNQIWLVSPSNRDNEYRYLHFRFTMTDPGWIAYRYYGQDTGMIHIPVKNDLFLRVAKVQLEDIALHWQLSSDIVNVIALFLQEEDVLDEKLSSMERRHDNPETESDLSENASEKE